MYMGVCGVGMLDVGVVVVLVKGNLIVYVLMLVSIVVVNNVVMFIVIGNVGFVNIIVSV